MTAHTAEPDGAQVGRDELASVRQAAERILEPLLRLAAAAGSGVPDEAVAAAGRALAAAGLAGAALPLAVRVEVALVAGGAGARVGARVLDLAEDPTGLLRASLAVGCGQAALRLGLDHAQHREAFGRPLAEFQVQRHAFAHAGARLMAAGALVRRAVESTHDIDVAAALPVACQACWQAAETALQVHGGYGYSDEFAISRLWLDAARLRASLGAASTAFGG